MINALRNAGRIAAELGLEDESDDYTKKAEKLCQKVNQYCWNEEKQAYVDTVRVQDGYYTFGSPAERTVGDPKEGEVRDGIVKVGTPFFMYFCLGMLWKYGMAEGALQLGRTAWGKMLEKGINTCWETFEMEGRKYTRSVVTPYGLIYVEVKKNSDGTLDISCQALAECVRVE